MPATRPSPHYGARDDIGLIAAPGATTDRGRRPITPLLQLTAQRGPVWASPSRAHIHALRLHASTAPRSPTRHPGARKKTGLNGRQGLGKKERHPYHGRSAKAVGRRPATLTPPARPHGTRGRKGSGPASNRAIQEGSQGGNPSWCSVGRAPAHRVAGAHDRQVTIPFPRTMIEGGPRPLPNAVDNASSQAAPHLRWGLTRRPSALVVPPDRLPVCGRGVPRPSVGLGRGLKE